MPNYTSGDITKSLFGYVDNKTTLSEIFSKAKVLKEPIDVTNQKKLKKHAKKIILCDNTSVDNVAFTLFVGNIPKETSKKDLIKLLKPHGKILNCRFRSMPLISKSTAYLPNMNKDVSKKSAISPITSLLSLKIAAKISQNNNPDKEQYFHSSRTNKNAYVNFESNQSVIEAIRALNGFYFKGTHHLRLDKVKSITLVIKKQLNANDSITHGIVKYDDKRTIFLGNLPTMNCEEEDIWNLFQEKYELPIEAVRIIRNKDAVKGTGCGFVLFKSSDSVPIALLMDEKQKINGRVIRIKKCAKPKNVCIVKRKNTKNAHKRNSV